MKRARNIKVGSLVEIPFSQFDRNRGLSGWTYRLGIVERLFTSTTGKACAEVRYIPRVASRYEMFPAIYVTKKLLLEYCFDPTVTVDCIKHNFPEMEEAEKNGEQVCWSEDTALLIDNGYLSYWKKA